MRNDKYCVIDTETGGVDEKIHALLTGCFVKVDMQGNETGRLNFRLKQQEGYTVTDGALAINKIDLIKHNLEADDRETVVAKIKAFFSDITDKSQRFMVMGQNPWFDLRFLYAQLPEINWNEIFDYHVFDTGSVTELMRITGFYPRGRSGSLGPTAEFFQISSAESHTADGDVNLCISLLKIYNRLKISVGV